MAAAPPQMPLSCLQCHFFQAQSWPLVAKLNPRNEDLSSVIFSTNNNLQEPNEKIIILSGHWPGPPFPCESFSYVLHLLVIDVGSEATQI